MKNGTKKCLTALALVCLMVMCVAVPLASAYTNAYGVTQAKLRVRETASTNSTIVDNIIKGGVVYITSSNNYGSEGEFAKIKYRNSDGDISTGWACIHDNKTTYIKVLSQAQTISAYGENIKGGTLPSAKVGTFTAAERKASAESSDSTYIKLNTRSDAVKTLQTKLKKLGYYTGELTGKAGEKTIAAIKDFQGKNGLTADGVAGPATLAKVDAAYSKLGSSSVSSSASGLKLNSNGTDVRDLQTDLTYLGYYWATISGNFGEKTETAVKRFQEESGLTVDGVAGTKTLNAIAEAVKKKGGYAASSSTSSNGSVLKLDSQGDKVSQLQTNLKTLGYYYATISGNFGPKTETAVKEFQKAKGLDPDGVAGARTLDAIDAAIRAAGGSTSTSSGIAGLKLGSTGSEVRALQEDLTTLSFYYGDCTGHFGSMTQTAVKKFQKSRGLTQDGVAGKKTLAAIASAVEGTGNVSASGSSSSSNALRRGDTNNPKIGDMQTRLKALDLYYGEITNDFGPKTETAVKKFQDKYGLTVDGIAGTATLNKLYSLTGGTTSGSTSSSSGSGTTVTTDKSYGKIIKNNVYLRAKASTSSASKASLTNGTLVRISKEYTTTDGILWYYISVKSGNYTYKGYVRSDMMERITEEQYNTAGGNSNNDSSDQEVLGMIRITGTGVRLRYSPSTDAQKVGEANKGDVFYYVSHSNGWYQTNAGYWLSDAYAKVMTSAEVEEYLGSSASGEVSGTYRYGSTGSAVETIKNMLLELGYNAGGQLTAGPFFGYNTEAAVKDFQRANELDPDGVVGSKTLKKLNDAYAAKLAGSSASTSYNSTIYNISWTAEKKVLKDLGLQRGKTVKLTDVASGLSFNAVSQNSTDGNHADMEPATAADTATLLKIYGKASVSALPYTRRGLVMTVGTEQFVCSIYPQAHGSQTITTNNYNGQFCIHFRNSTIHSGDGTHVADSENHQAIISNTVTTLKARGISIVEDYPNDAK